MQTWFADMAVLEQGVETPSLSIGVLTERRYLSHAQPTGMMGALRSMGHTVSLIDPQATSLEVSDHRWLESLDLMIVRGRSWGVLSLLTWAEAQRIPTLNRRAAIAAVHNKAEMAVTLASHHIRTPLTWLGSTEQLAVQIETCHFPVLLKPLFGDNGNGLKLVYSRWELAKLEWPEPVALTQKFIPGISHDLKLYGIGNEVWAVRKPSPFQATRSDSLLSRRKERLKAYPVPLTPEMEALARRCRTLFDLDLYGLDCLETDAGLVVIEVNEFPNYSGIPEADEKLARYVFEHAVQRRSR